MESSFDGRFTNAESLRGLGNVEVLHVPQNEYLAVDVRQLGQCLGDCFTHFLLLNCVTREFPPVGKLLRVKRLLLGGYRVLINGLVKMSGGASADTSWPRFQSLAWPIV